MQDTANEKTAVRKQLRAITKALTSEYKQQASGSITRQCLDSTEYKEAGSIFIYISMDGEPDTKDIIRQALSDGKDVYVPRCLSDGIMEAVKIDSFECLKPGHYGILEPDEALGSTDVSCFDSETAVAFVPCVGASRDGRRMGHGAGYYDRFLENRSMKKIMLVYGAQIMPDIPCDEHDIIMDRVITEQQKPLTSNAGGFDNTAI